MSRRFASDMREIWSTQHWPNGQCISAPFGKIAELWLAHQPSWLPTHADLALFSYVVGWEVAPSWFREVAWVGSRQSPLNRWAWRRFAPAAPASQLQVPRCRFAARGDSRTAPQIPSQRSGLRDSWDIRSGVGAWSCQKVHAADWEPTRESILASALTFFAPPDRHYWAFSFSHNLSRTPTPPSLRLRENRDAGVGVRLSCGCVWDGSGGRVGRSAFGSV